MIDIQGAEETDATLHDGLWAGLALGGGGESLVRWRQQSYI